MAPPVDKLSRLSILLHLGLFLAWIPPPGHRAQPLFGKGILGRWKDCHTASVPTDTSTFALQRSMIRRTVADGSVIRHPESHFLDFVIDGHPLSVRTKSAVRLVTPLNRPWLSSVPDAIDELTGRRASPGLDAGRVALLVCPECGDLSCGAVTASLDIDAGFVIWADFLWEDGNSPASTVEDAPDSIVLIRSEYEEALRTAYADVADLPYDERSELGRRSR